MYTSVHPVQFHPRSFIEWTDLRPWGFHGVVSACKRMRNHFCTVTPCPRPFSVHSSSFARREHIPGVCNVMYELHLGEHTSVPLVSTHEEPRKAGSRCAKRIKIERCVPHDFTCGCGRGPRKSVRSNWTDSQGKFWDQPFFPSRGCLQRRQGWDTRLWVIGKFPAFNNFGVLCQIQAWTRVMLMFSSILLCR